MAFIFCHKNQQNVGGISGKVQHEKKIERFMNGLTIGNRKMTQELLCSLWQYQIIKVKFILSWVDDFEMTHLEYRYTNI